VEPRDRRTVTGVNLQQTGDKDTSDFLTLSHSGKATRTNEILIRYAGGHTLAYDADSDTEHGLRDSYLELGAVISEEEAIAIGEAIMEIRKDPSFTTTAKLHPASDATMPYTSFGVGDWVNCPDETDTPASMRVNSITWEEDRNGVVDWTVTLRDIPYEEEERHRAWLRRMADGVMVGGARVSSRAGTPPIISGRIVDLKVAEFSFDNVQLVESNSPRRPADVSCNLVEVVGELTTPGSTTTAVEIRLNGSEITTLNFGAGETEDEKALDLEPVRANVDKLQCEITVAGSGAEGLDIQVRGI